MLQMKHKSIGFLGAIVSVYIIAWLIQAHLLLNPDVSWLMDASARLVSGGTYTKDFFETNPPLILYLYMPATLTTKFFHIGMHWALRGYVFLLISLCLYASSFFIRKIFSGQDGLLANLFLITLAIVLLVVPTSDFGQREHLLVILSMPYIFMVVCRLQQQNIHAYCAAAVGLVAGIGFAIKPYFLVVPALIELYYLFYKKNLFAWMRIEIFIMIAFLIFYMGVIYLFYSDYLYLVVPFARRLYYKSIEMPWTWVFINPVVLFCYLPTLFFIAEYKKSRYKAFISIMYVALIGFFLTYFIQQKVMFYHLYPVFSLAVLNFVLLLGLFANQPHTSKDYFGLIAIFVIPMIAFLLYEASYIWVVIVLEPINFFSFFAVLFSALFCMGLQNRSLAKIACYVAGIIAVGYLFSYMALRDNNSAHQFSMTVVLLLFLFSFIMQQSYKNKHHYIVVAILSMLIFSYPVLFVSDRYSGSLDKRRNFETVYEYIRSHALHKSVYFFASEYYAHPCVDYVDVTSASRFSFFWMLLGLISADPSMSPRMIQQKQADKNFLIGMISEDIEKNKPAYVFVDVRKQKPYMNNVEFNFLNYFLQNKHFETIWKNYHYVTTLTIQGTLRTEKLAVYQRATS